MRLLRSAWLLPLLPACSATHLVYVHETSVGVGLAASGTEGNTNFSFGYDSQTFAIVPRYQEDDEAKNARKLIDGSRDDVKYQEAMSLVAANQTYVEGVNRIVIHHALATGAPAIEVAKSASTIATIVGRTLLDATASAAKKRLDGVKR